jgi:hypothetical protein
MKGEKKREWATCDHFRTLRQMGLERLDSRIDNRSSTVTVLEVYLVYLPSRNC